MILLPEGLSQQRLRKLRVLVQAILLLANGGHKVNFLASWRHYQREESVRVHYSCLCKRLLIGIRSSLCMSPAAIKLALHSCYPCIVLNKRFPTA